MAVSKAKSQASNCLALKKSKDKVFKEKASKYKKLQEQEGKKENFKGVIFVSNIPHGFFESQMNKFFSQFGKVGRCRLARSNRTGQSCGYGYVEFQHKEVAKIVAKQMDGYLTFGKIMKCQYIPPENVSKKMFPLKSIRPHNCPKILSRKKAINKLNKFRSEKKVNKRLERLTETYKKKLRKLESFGISLNLDLPEVETQVSKEKHNESMEESLSKETSDSEKMDINENQKSELAEVKQNQALQVKVYVSSKPKKMKNINGTVAKPSHDNDSHHSSQSPGKMVIEVDESDGEIQFKTPPNAVKKFVKLAPSLGENSISVKPIPVAAKKRPLKQKSTTEGLSVNIPLKELVTATAEGANPDESNSLENKISSVNPSVTRKKKVPKSKKKKLVVEGISEIKEIFLQTPATLALPEKVESIQDNTPLSPANDISTSLKRKEANDQTGKKLSKKRKVSVAKFSSAKGTQENRKASISNQTNQIDTSSCMEGMTNISQLPPDLQTPGQPSKRFKSPKESKKTISALIIDTQAPKKANKADTAKSEIEKTSGVDAVKDVKMMKSILHSSPAEETTIQTPEPMQIPSFSKKNKTPKSKTKKIVAIKRTGSLSYIETPKKSDKAKSEMDTSSAANIVKDVDAQMSPSVDLVQTDQDQIYSLISDTQKPLKVNETDIPKSPLSHSLPPKIAILENSVFPESEIGTPSGNNAVKDVEVMKTILQSSGVENSKQTSEPEHVPLSSKKSKTPKDKTKKIASLERTGSLDCIQTPKKADLKKVVTTKTVHSNNVPLKEAELENVTVFPKNKIESSPRTVTTRNVEVMTDISCLSPTVENSMQIEEQVQFTLATKKFQTPKSKIKKTLSLKVTGSPDYTPQKVERVKKVVTPKTADSHIIPCNNETNTSFRISKAKDSEVHVSPAVENPIQTSEKVQLPPSSKKVQTPKNKIKKTKSQKKTGNPGYTQTAENGKGIFTPKTGDSISIPCKNEIEASPTANTALSLSDKKTKTSKKTPKRKNSLDYTKTPKKVKPVQNTDTFNTPECNGLPPKIVESKNVIISSESEMKMPLMNTAESVEMIPNTFLLSPEVEIPIQTSNQVPQSSKKTKTPKNKVPKKAFSLKKTSYSDITQTPKKKSSGKELITKTIDFNKSSSKKSKLGNSEVVLKEECISSTIKKVMLLSPAHLKETPKQKIKPKVPKTA